MRLRPHTLTGMVVLAVCLLALAPRSAAAQESAGIRAGVSADPDQFYFGGHLQTRPLVDRLRFRPNVEIGLGDDLTVIALNFEFAYFFPTQRAWGLYAGGGPALNIVDHEDDSEAEGGFNIMIGVEHRGGLFAELKVGAIDSPDLKFGVGYTFR